MAELRDKTACRTPAKGRDGVTNIPTWKFDLLRGAILAVLEQADTPVSELKEAIRARISHEDIDRLGSLSWHMMTVKLELEVRGEIHRIPGPGKQVLTLENRLDLNSRK